MERVFKIKFADVYRLYVAKVERKGRTKAELDSAIEWLTGFSPTDITSQIDKQASFREFFQEAKLNPQATQITGLICGTRVEEIKDPLMQKIRYLDKVVDELARGKSLLKITNREKPAKS